MSSPSSQPVNFLLIITDQQRASTLGCYGSRIGATPHIDSLAKSGWRAENFIVASPLCMPNRASMMTGRMPSVHGVRHNGIPLRWSTPTVASLLREAGWNTALIGKAHWQNMMREPGFYPTDPARRSLIDLEDWKDGRYDQENCAVWEQNPQHDIEYPFYGFDTVHLTVEHGDKVQGHYRRWLYEHEPKADRLIGAENAIPTPDYELSHIHQAWRTQIPSALSSTHYVADKTIECLEQYANQSQPFFIQCSFPDPHHPLTVPGDYWGKYRPEDMELPLSFHAKHTGLPPTVRWLYERRAQGNAIKNRALMFASNERETREFIALSYGSIAQIDDGVGRILHHLQARDLAKNTVVIFTSDHGDFFGDHQLLLKGPLHYQGILRPPFIWRDPEGVRGESSNAMTGTIDIAPSILERAQVLPYYGMQGRSLLPLMKKEGTWTRLAMLVEEEGQRTYLGFADRVRMRTLVTTRYRLSIYENALWGELYDLADDPHELHNRWDDPGVSSIKSDLLYHLSQEMLAYTDMSPRPTGLA